MRDGSYSPSPLNCHYSDADQCKKPRVVRAESFLEGCLHIRARLAIALETSACVMCVIFLSYLLCKALLEVFLSLALGVVASVYARATLDSLGEVERAVHIFFMLGQASMAMVMMQNI